MKPHFCWNSHKHEDGFALALTLALILLVTFVVVAYFLEPQRTAGSRITASAVRADVLARSAAEIILSDIKTEIAGGSVITQPASQMPIYSPSDATKAGTLPRAIKGVDVEQRKLQQLGKTIRS